MEKTRLKEHLDSFDSPPFLHDLFQKTLKNLMLELVAPHRDDIIFLFGPAGVGKSTIVAAVIDYLLAEFDPLVQPGTIPLVSMEATAHDQRFRFPDLYELYLSKLNEPLIDHKLVPPNWREIADSKTEAALRRALESATRNRHTRFAFIDEAQHIATTTSDVRLQHHVDVIKSLSNVTGVTHVLVGSYELLRLRNRSSQLIRRNRDVHFPRYRADSNEDIDSFRTANKTLMLRLPLNNQENLDSHWEYLYQYSIGCIGVLQSWYRRALIIALDSEYESVGIDLMKKTAIDSEEVATMWKDVVQAEIQLEDAKTEGRDAILSIFNLERERVSGKKQTPPKESTQKTNSSKKRAPFEQAPSRRRRGPESISPPGTQPVQNSPKDPHIESSAEPVSDNSIEQTVNEENSDTTQR